LGKGRAKPKQAAAHRRSVRLHKVESRSSAVARLDSGP
jgi:hypothetical protein